MNNIRTGSLLSFVFISVFALCASAQSSDRAIVRRILDEVGRKDVQVEDVTQLSRDGRVIQLNLNRRGIDGVAIVDFPMEVLKLDALKGLLLKDNKISDLPDEIGQMRELVELNLASNPIQTLPPTIGNLTNLRILDLRQTGLSGLPPEFGNLRNLETLQLWNNQFVVLPDCILELENLKELYLKNNKLITLPENMMKRMPNLTYVDVHLNNICNLSPKMHEWLVRLDRRYQSYQKCN